MKSISCLIILALALTSCSFSKQGRQQRSYEKYVRKSSAMRQKQRSKFHNGKPQMPTSPMPSEPMQSTSSGPEATAPSDSQSN